MQPSTADIEKAPSAPRPRSLLRELGARFGLVVFGLVAGFLLLEVGLQVSAVLLRPSMRHGAASATTGSRRIVTIGDSNTYGLWVKKEQAYPRVLERLWNATPGAPSIEVVNLGFPGTNSSDARNIVREAIETFHPDLITVMVGANDWWTESHEVRDLDWRERMSMWLWGHSRVYRLLFMIGRAGQNPTVRVTDEHGVDATPGVASVMHIGDASVDIGVQRRDQTRHVGENPFTEMEANLKAMLDDARRAGVEVVLVTYPATDRVYGAANDRIRNVATTAGVRLVDVAAAILPECPEAQCDLLLPDHHPTVAGHERTADILRAALMAKTSNADSARP